MNFLLKLLITLLHNYIINAVNYEMLSHSWHFKTHFPSQQRGSTFSGKKMPSKGQFGGDAGRFFDILFIFFLGLNVTWIPLGRHRNTMDRDRSLLFNSKTALYITLQLDTNKKNILRLHYIILVNKLTFWLWLRKGVAAFVVLLGTKLSANRIFPSQNATKRGLP